MGKDLDYKKFESVFEEAPSVDKINYTLAILTPRKIDNGNSIKFQNKYYPTEFEEEEYYEEDKKETEKKVYKTYREEPKKKK